MSPALAGVALAVTAGAVIAASSREARAALIGLALVLGLGPFLTDPLPGPAVLGARVVTGILVVYLLRAVSAGSDGRPASRIGWPAEAVLALAAALAGIAVATGLGSIQPDGPGGGEAPGPLAALTPSAIALGAGFASLVVGLAPAFLGRHALRAGIGLLLVVQGIVLARTGLAGPPGELEQLGIDALVLAVGAACGLLVLLDQRAATDDAALDTEAALEP